MKKSIIIFATILSIFALNSCSDWENSDYESGGSCGTYNGKPTYKGSNGGCYYYNSSGNKQYVDRSYCPC